MAVKHQKIKGRTAKKKPAAPHKKRSASGKKRRTAVKTKKGVKLTPKALKTLAICAVLVIAVMGIVAAAAHGKAGRHSTVTPPDKEIAWGIDVSSHNGKIDWQAVSTQADFAFVRVGFRGYTEGEINTDSEYKNNLNGANKNGVPVGVYFYSQAVNEDEAKEEAAFVLDCIKGYDISLPVVIDFEYPQKNGKHIGRLWDAALNKKSRTSLINAFCDTVRDAGYTPAIYASTYIYESQLNLGSIDDDVFIWVADYNSSITYDGYYDIWQYSETGDCDGVSSKNVDTDYWYTKNRLNN